LRRFVFQECTRITPSTSTNVSKPNEITVCSLWIKTLRIDTLLGLLGKHRTVLEVDWNVLKVIIAAVKFPELRTGILLCGCERKLL
jgi:hypothetical protein